MLKKALVIGLFGALALSWVFLVFRERGQKLGILTNSQTTPSRNEQSISSQEKNVLLEGISDDPKFVTDVDPDVSHWQTKETEFFTIKFPKEWYWMESDLEKTGYHSEVITNNPHFDIDKYADIGIFTGGVYPLILTNDRQVIITTTSASTEDAGSPQDSINAIVNTPREYAPDPSEVCKQISSSGNVPVTAFCSFTDRDHNQKVQTYSIAYNTTTFSFSARTTENNDATVMESILEKIAKSFTIKDKSFN